MTGATANTAKWGNVRRALWWYALAVWGMTTLAVLFVSVRAYVFHRPYLYNSLLFLPEVRFSDFTM